ncbi:hypothetical protein Hs30E_19450 [Lactococcus hodotermopsidis]|uniref:HTH cro/C1-type domain-containing protein n=1 Tax=Pseudolactococcus hodotermopsidis TaxID=2709157 RepID=A0A6A0BFX3_9LACT|nr:helix-turn-helix transcriptional regulator [Lactococcus hodotermopsidis]GFH43394.1 hypothetical protein Hs30E_19450 [Lactococcus hodotermopsidis]
MNTNEQIISIIINRRKELGLSLSEVARRMNIPKSTLSRYENQQRQFPLDLIQTISEALDLSSSQLLGLTQLSKKNKATEKTQIITETIEIMEKLDKNSQANILNFAKFEYAQAEKATKTNEIQNTAS